MFTTVLRNRGILVRIRIRGSVFLNNKSGSGSCYFSPVTFMMKTKNIFVLFFGLLLILFEGTFTSFFKDKKS